MVWEWVIRLFVAGVLGALIGLDREYRAKEAGYRTHFLVSLGSALIMLVSQYGFLELFHEKGVAYDSSRVAAQVVSGIGFIGAGTIIFLIFKSVGMKSSLIEFSTNNKKVLDEMRNRLDSKDYIVVSYQMEQQNHQDVVTYQVCMVVKARRSGDESLFSLLREFQDDMVIYRIE